MKKIIKKHVFLLTAIALTVVMVLGLTFVPAKDALAANKMYNVQVTGKLVRSELPKLLELINQKRQEAGVPQLLFDAKAMKIAEKRAAESSLLCDHATPYGDTSRSWTSIEGNVIYDNTVMGENIHYGPFSDTDNATEVFDGWWNSSGHKEALLRDGVTRVGLAIYTNEKDDININRAYKTCTAVFVSMIELTDESYGGPSKFPNKPREYLIPYTEGFADAVRTFEFQAYPDCIRFVPQTATTELSVGKATYKMPYYYQIAGSGNRFSGYSFDSGCGTWRSSEQSVASVAPDGTVTGMAPGNATITFALNGDTAKSFSYNVEVKANIPAPINMKAEKEDGKMVLTWDALGEADGYEIYKCDDEYGSYKVVGQTTDTWFEAPIESTTMYYKMKAYRELNGQLYYSPFNLALEVEASGLPAPKDVILSSATSSKLKITWSEVSKAEGYQTQISACPEFSSPTSYLTTSTSKTATVKKTGTIYYVRVRAYELSGKSKKYGMWSDTLPAKTKTAKVTIKSAVSPKSKQLKVIYKKVAGASGYQIYISTSSRFTSKSVYTTATLSKTMKVKKKKTNYYIKVRAYYNNGGSKTYGAFSKPKKVRSK